MTDDQFGAALEDIDSKLDAIIESVSFMASATQLTELDDHLQTVESDVKIIKDVVREHSLELRKLTTV